MEPLTEKHPSYALVSFSRRRGNPGRLFGSSLQSHEAYVTLQVRYGSRILESGYDRFYGNIHGDILELDLSAAQFAELLTTMNVGMGVPGTLRRLLNKPVEKPPAIVMEEERIRTGFKEEMKRFAQKLQRDAGIVKAILMKKSLTVSDKDAILSTVTSVLNQVESNIPLTLTLFGEAAERIATHAKAEVDAFITNNVFAAGMRALREEQKQLPEKTEQPVREVHDESK